MASKDEKLRAAYAYYHELLNDNTTSGPIVQQAANLFAVNVRELSKYIEAQDGIVDTKQAILPDTL